jgi:hypothetical protein
LAGGDYFTISPLIAAFWSHAKGASRGDFYGECYVEELRPAQFGRAVDAVRDWLVIVNMVAASRGWRSSRSRSSTASGSAESVVGWERLWPPGGARERA